MNTFCADLWEIVMIFWCGVFGGGLCFFWNALRVVFFEMLCGGGGGVPRFASLFFLKCFAAGWGTKIGFAHLVPRLRGWLKIKNPYSIKTALLPVLFFVPITVIQASLMPPICKKIRPNKFGLNEIQILLFRRGTKIRFAHLVPLPAGLTENKESVFH